MVVKVMRFINIKSCKIGLDFKPQSPWPEALPPISWNHWLIAGFHSPMTEALQITTPSFHGALHSCYSFLSLPELARLYKLIQLHQTVEPNKQVQTKQAQTRQIQAKQTQTKEALLYEQALEINWGALFKEYHLKDSENLRLTLSPLAQTPMPFQDWCSQKQIAPRDLAILRSFKDPTQIKALFLNPRPTQPLQIFRC